MFDFFNDMSALYYRQEEFQKMYLNSFSNEEYLLAQEAFSSWQTKTYENIEDYILRQRKSELNELVNKVIKNELSSTDKLLVELHWYQNMSKREIAKKLAIDPSTVTRRLNRISDIIYEKLKYALEYRYGSGFQEKARLIIKNKDALFSYQEPEILSERIRKLRKSQFLTEKEVSDLTGISESRLKEIENSGREMTVTEMKKLALFYKTSADYIIFGYSPPANRKGWNS